MVRLVRYTGAEMTGAGNLSASEAEARIRHAIYEGFQVAWNDQNGRAYLCIWEPWAADDPPPPWEKVFSEQHLR